MNFKNCSFFMRKRQLFIRQSNLIELSPKLQQLTNLETIDISDNQITDLPLEIINLLNCNYLYMNDNPMVMDNKFKRKISSLLPGTYLRFNL